MADLVRRRLSGRGFGNRGHHPPRGVHQHQWIAEYIGLNPQLAGLGLFEFAPGRRFDCRFGKCSFRHILRISSSLD